MSATKEFRITRMDRMVRGQHANEVPASQRLGYYIKAKTAKDALKIAANRFPGVEVELDNGND